MNYPKLPQQWTSGIISTLGLREFGLLCAQYGFFAVWTRMDDSFFEYWEKTAPGTTFAEFLGKAHIPC